MGVLNLIPLVILFAFVGGIGWFGYQIYLYSNDLATKGKAHLEKKNISFSNDGMKVGVKEMRAEDYEDSTQNVLVKTWNLANESKATGSLSQASKKPDISRSGSGVSSRSNARS